MQNSARFLDYSNMQEIIKKIIDAGIRAPSGENCQPWRFEISGNEILLFNLPERDSSLYGWGQRSSYLAHGALLENMSIAASALGYDANIVLFPNPSQTNLVAHVTLSPVQPKNESLYPAIAKRATNRKPYKKIPLTVDQKAALVDAGESFDSDCRFILVEEDEQRKKIAKLASRNEKIIFGNKSLHSFFFGHINWTKEEDDEKSIGFYIKTLELPPPVETAFKIIKKWSVMRILNKLGFSSFVAGANSSIYGASSAIGVVLVSRNTPEDFIHAGRLTERIWLTATSLDLSVQPLAGLIYLMHRIRANEIQDFSPAQVKIIKDAYKGIETVLDIRDNNSMIAMMFRIGTDGEPSARSPRLRPHIMIKN